MLGSTIGLKNKNRSEEELGTRARNLKLFPPDGVGRT